MRLLTTCLIFALAVTVLISTGCSSPDARLRAQRLESREKIDKLKAEVRQQSDANDDLERKLGAQEDIVEEIKKENEEQDKKFQQMCQLHAQAGQPGPLSAQMTSSLSAFAREHADLLSYDPTKGLVKLNSDFTFDTGSDRVKPEAALALDALARICSTKDAQAYQVLIVGHTDDIPIVRPETMAKHPTNWHLSVHRAIAVMDVLKKNMPEEQLAVMGFGEFRPAAPNQPNHRGNSANRRVEIFITPKGTIIPSAGVEK